MAEQPHNEHSGGQAHAHDDIHLGIAGRMSRSFIMSPVSPLLLVACLAVGILGLLLTPRQEDPQISVPMVDIFVEYAGASAEQVSALVTDPLERIMSEITGVKHVYSVSQRGRAMVTVEFDVGEEMTPSLVKLYDKLQSNMDKIPPGVTQPLVKPKAVDDVPVVTLTLWSQDVQDDSLRLLALDILQRLKQVPNTSQGFIVGGRAEQIRVEVMPERLSGHGISLQQVAGTITTANAEQTTGSVESGNTSFTVYSGSFLRSAEDVSRLVVGTHNNVPVYVSDVAKVYQGPEDARALVNYFSGAAYPEGYLPANGAAAVTLAVAKKQGSNGVTVANDVLAKVEELKGRLIPDNVQVAVTRNYGKTANDKVNDLIFKLFIATAAVCFLVWLSLGWRPAVVVMIVIPVVILVTVFSALILDYTIDRVSLFALIFAIGILVDDAIVVVENIYRRWLLKGQMDVETSVDAVAEVGNPTIVATLTVIAALLPMGFVSGMMGPYMRPIPVLGSVAMAFSLFAAFAFTPWLAWRIKPTMKSLRRAEEREHKTNQRLESFYRWLLVPLIISKAKGWLFLLVIIALFFGSCALLYTTDVSVKMLPLDNKPEFNIVINMPEGTALPVTANLTWQVAEAVRKVPEVTAIQSYVGTASPFNFNGLVRHYYLRQEPWMADLQVQLLDKNERARTSHEIAMAVRDLVTPLANALGGRIQVVEMPPGPPVLQSVVAEIYGPDPETRRQVARDMTTMFAKAENITDVDNYLQEPFEIWRFEVDTEKAVRRGISVETINQNLAMAMGGYKLGDIKRGTVLEPTYIVIQVPLSVRAQFARLGDLPIPTQTGGTLPLAELGRFYRTVEDQPIYHKDLRALEYVTGEVTGRLEAPIYGMFQVEDLLAEYTTPDGVTGLTGEYLGPPRDVSKTAFEWGGEWTVTYETFRDMGLAFGAAIILIYMLVVWEFGNFIHPAIIISPIPLTLVGIVPGHWLLDAHFTATSMIGFIALAGIIVRNSILLVDFTVHEVAAGTPVRDAVVLACKTRTRPILITALALVGGSSVILFDPIFQGMAISLLFGVLVSTLLTLVVIPLGCISARSSFVPEGAEGELLCRLCDTEEQERVLAGKKSSGGFAAALGMVFYVLRALFYFLAMGLKSFAGFLWNLAQRSRAKDQPPPATPPAGGGGEPPGGGASGGGGATAPVATGASPGNQAPTTEAPSASERPASDPAGEESRQTAAADVPHLAVTKAAQVTAPRAEKVAQEADEPVAPGPETMAPQGTPATERDEQAAGAAKKTQRKAAPKREAAKKSAPKKTPGAKSKGPAGPVAEADGSADAGGTEGQAEQTSLPPITPSLGSESGEEAAPTPPKRHKRRGIRLKPDIDEKGSR